jgi:hypothetical protein
VGAFNLVRTAKYREAGGHAPIAMRPDDDMKLAKLLKLHGGQQELIDAGKAVHVVWYANVAEAVYGLEKNSFSGCEYSWTRLTAATVALSTFAIWPWVALFTTTGPLRALNVAILALTLLMAGGVAAGSGGKAAYALAFPLSTLLFIYVLWNAALKAALNGGIDWRGTKYPLAELRRNRI